MTRTTIQPLRIQSDTFVHPWEFPAHGMAFNQISPNENIASNLIALNQWGEQIGRTPATIWRWRRDGWLEVVNIAGRVYISRQAIAEFERRAAAGEFAKEHITPKRSAAR